MHRLRLYLDTSVISLFFQDESAERMMNTRDFFRNVVEMKTHDVYISTVVLDEIADTPDKKRREMMLQIVSQYSIPTLAFQPGDEDIERLANAYLNLRIIPATKWRDAVHVALATLHEMDMLVTWNYRHLANVEREARIADANKAEGFMKPLRLITPLEVAYS